MLESGNNKEKKVLFNFTKATLIDRFLKDKADVERRNKSSVAEQIILDTFLPENKSVRRIIECYLYSDNNPIGNILSEIFSYNAAGNNWKSLYDNLLPLVIFASKQSVLSTFRLNGDEPDLYHCASQFDTIISILERIAEENDASKFNILHEIKFAKILLKDLEDHPSQIKLSNHYSILINNWEYLKDSTFTYRLLRDLTILEKGWFNNSETRIELLQIIKDVTSEWD